MVAWNPPLKKNRRELAGRVAVVTGASSGIGQAMAVELASAGAAVVVHGNRNEAGARETAARIASNSSSSEVHILLADLATKEGQSKFVEEAWQWKNGVDIWINNAGVDVLTGELASASFDEKIRTTLAGRCCSDPRAIESRWKKNACRGPKRKSPGKRPNDYQHWLGSIRTGNGGRRGRTLRRDQGGSDFIHAEPGSIVGTASASSLPCAGLDSDCLGRRGERKHGRHVRKTIRFSVDGENPKRSLVSLDF